MTGIRAGSGDLFPAFKEILQAHDRPFLDELVFGNLSDVEEYLVPEALREAYRAYLRSDDGLSTLPAVYSAVWLTVWLRHTGLRP